MRSAPTCNANPILVTALLVLLGARTASALEKPANLRATYNAASDQLVVEWDKVSGADKYKVVVQTPGGAVVVKSSTTGSIRKFAGAKFEKAEEYKVKVQTLDGGSRSKFTTKSYVHTLSRAPGKGVLLTANAFERTGNYYLPPNFGKTPRPLMVGLHGQGGAGDSMVGAFSGLAKEHGFIIVAPSSGLLTDGTSAWTVGESGTATPDFDHIRSCIEEVLEFEDVRVDPTRVLAVGYSAGGAVAPYFATADVNTDFTHFGVLHGGIFFSTLGDRIVPAWLSTGTSDPLRTPTELKGYESALRAIGFDVVYTEYPTDHALAKKELRGVAEWWLDK